MLTTNDAKRMPIFAPANTSHQWWRLSVIREIEQSNANSKKNAWTVGMSNLLRIFGVRTCKYLNQTSNLSEFDSKFFTWNSEVSKRRRDIVNYQIKNIASKNDIDEWPDGNDFDASRTNKALSTSLVHFQSVMYVLEMKCITRID